MDPKGIKLYVPLKGSPHQEKHFFLKFYCIKNKTNKMILTPKSSEPLGLAIR